MPTPPLTNKRRAARLVLFPGSGAGTGREAAGIASSYDPMAEKRAALSKEATFDPFWQPNSMSA